MYPFHIDARIQIDALGTKAVGLYRVSGGGQRFDAGHSMVWLTTLRGNHSIDRITHSSGYAPQRENTMLYIYTFFAPQPTMITIII